MLKTMKNLINLMESQKKQLYLSLLFSFIDGCLLVVPMVMAFRMMGSIPEFFPSTQSPLNAQMVTDSALIMAVCLVLRIVLRYFTTRLRSGAGYKVLCEQRKLLGQRLRGVSMGYFSKKNLGDLVSTIVSDASLIEIEGMGVVEKIALGIPSLVVSIILLLVLDYRIALVTLLLLLPTWFAYKRLSTTQKRLGLDRQKLIAEVTEDAVEFVAGLPVLKTYNMTDKLFYRTKDAFRKLRELSVRIELSHLLPAGIFQACFRVVSCVIILMAGLFAVYGQMQWPVAFLLMLSALSLFSGAEMMGIYSVFAEMTGKSVERIDQVKDVPQMTDSAAGDISGQFDIAFHQVNFAYDTVPVLNDISFEVPENTITALVGPSGGGKSTIANLIARFWDVGTGTVSVGGVDIRTLPYEKLLQMISFVFQDVFLFNDTVANNIRIGRPNADMQQVVEAAKRAGCHTFITALDNGYETMVGEGGARLSGGERQRISIARALLKDAPIVLLDEATANVDAENEQQIQAGLMELLKNRTVVMIAHKLTTVRGADQILVLEDGKISQRGTHDSLMVEDGLYRKLWNMQYETGLWRV